MKKLHFILVTMALLPTTLLAQITIAPFPAQIKCDIDGVSELPAIEATSTAGKVRVTAKEDIFSGGCLGTLVRTFDFTDDAGNKASAQQFVSLTDNEAPKLYGEAPDISTTDDMIPEPVTFASRDNSGRSYDVIFSESKNGNQIIRIWTCTDDCGNEAEKKQIITLE